MRVSFSLTVAACAAQEPNLPVRVGPGTTAPKLTYKVEPEYSPFARADHIQGNVVLRIIVDENGMPKDIQVVSPLGFGLDEKAEEAIAKWRFVPGSKDGKPVPVIAMVEVNFRFPTIWFDQKAEKRRTSFNIALKSLNDPTMPSKEKFVKTIQDLAKQKFAPAMYYAGVWETDGACGVAKDPADGWPLIQAAAKKHYGPAMYEVAIRAVKAGGDPEEMEKQRQVIQDAAVLGSIGAQFYLGGLYEEGKDVPADPARARRYFRLCAVKGVPSCRYRLGRLLIAGLNPADEDYAQGIAWIELAADDKVDGASATANQALSNLSEAQLKMVGAWKKQLVPK